MANILVIIITLLFTSNALAKDFGILGEVFPIKEKDPVELIKSKLTKMEKSGELAEIQKKWQETSIKRTKRPKDALPIIKKADKNSVRYFNPSITLTENLTDHQGKIFAFKGTTVNPFDYFPNYFPRLIFIDGDDEQQVTFALKQSDSESKIILIRGNIINLMKKYQVRMYFDQQSYDYKYKRGLLVSKFGIEKFPAIVTREGKMLKIQEVVL